MSEILEAAKAGLLARVSEIIALDPKAVNERDKSGNTALHNAIFICNKKLVCLLLENGADRAASANVCGTPLETAEMILRTQCGSVSPDAETIRDYEDIIGLLNETADETLTETPMDRAKAGEFEKAESRRMAHYKKAVALFHGAQWSEAVTAYRELIADMEYMASHWKSANPEEDRREWAGFHADLAVCLTKPFEEDELIAQVMLKRDPGVTVAVKTALQALSILPNDEAAQGVVQFHTHLTVMSKLSRLDIYPSFPEFAR